VISKVVISVSVLLLYANQALAQYIDNVGELIFGLGVRYRKIDLIFSQSVRSDEFNGQTENLQFGSLMLRFQLGSLCKNRI